MFSKKLMGLLAGLAVASVGMSAQASVSYTTAGTAYTQNFNSQAGKTGDVAWTNDSTIPGWSLYESGGNGSGTNAPAGTPGGVWAGTNVTTATTGASYTVGATYPFYLYQYSPTNAALAFYNADSNSASSTGYIAAGVTLTNDTGSVLDTVTISYEAIALTATTSDSVALSYALNATGLADANGTYTPIVNGGYTLTSGSALDSVITVTLSGITWNPGDTITIRWKDGNVSGTDRLSKIDAVSINGTSSVAVPEPASLSLLAIAGSGLLLRRRR